MKQEREGQKHRGLWTELFFEAFTGIYVLVVVVIFWRRPFWTSLLLGGSLVMQLWFWREKADVAAMVAA
ncbi:MAG: hypothetical protein JRF69_09860, partial [Deltaproteobacteria bacterium]|nr:hypothetical protein [Deltaproteobacteria bacterium]